MASLSIIAGSPEQGALQYNDQAHGFDTTPRSSGAGASLLVNDLQLELDEDGVVLHVWGLCPRESWEQRDLSLPSARDARLQWNEEVEPGISVRLNKAGRWKTYYDGRTSLLCIGDPDSEGDAVRFAPGSVGVFDGGVLCSLWFTLSAGHLIA